MPRPIHLDIPADDPDRAVAFYQKVFDWKIQKWDGPMEYWFVSTGNGPGIDGGVARRREPGEGPVTTIDVPSLDDYVKRVERGGGKVVVPRMPIPGIGWLAYFQDPEGNTFGLMEEDAKAG